MYVLVSEQHGPDELIPARPVPVTVTRAEIAHYTGLQLYRTGARTTGAPGQ